MLDINARTLDASDVTGEDILDPRDLNALVDKLRELKAEHAACHQCGDPMRTNDDGTTNHVTAEGETDHDADADHVAYTHPNEYTCPACDEDAAHLLEVLEAAEDQWGTDESLIRDTYFETYAREFARDIGAIEDDTRWPCDCIDWKEAADDLKQDYTEVDIDGTAYWMRG